MGGLAMAAFKRAWLGIGMAGFNRAASLSHRVALHGCKLVGMSPSGLGATASTRRPLPRSTGAITWLHGHQLLRI